MKMSDRQRRAMFAKINKAGVSLSPAEVEIKSSTYDGVYSPVKGIDVVASDESVPDWVTAPVEKPVQEEPKSDADLSALAEYGKAVLQKDDEPIKTIDKSDTIKQADDFIAQYGKNLPKEKKIVGAAKMDDEYALEGPIKLVIRNRVRKDLDDILLNV